MSIASEYIIQRISPGEEADGWQTVGYRLVSDNISSDEDGLNYTYTDSNLSPSSIGGDGGYLYRIGAKTSDAISDAPDSPGVAGYTVATNLLQTPLPSGRGTVSELIMGTLLIMVQHVSLTLGYCTIADNASTSDTGAGGIGTSELSSTGSIIIGNQPTDISSGQTPTGSYNLIGDGTGGFDPAANNILGTTEYPFTNQLALLGYYGGPTQTMPPLTASSALGAGGTYNNGFGATYTGGYGSIDNGTGSLAITTDQRGQQPGAGFSLDIGAVQEVPIVVSTTNADPVGPGQLNCQDALNLSAAMGGNQPIAFSGSPYNGSGFYFGSDPSQVLWASWPTSISDPGTATVSLTQGFTNAINDWTVVWKDANGNVLRTDSDIDGSVPSDTYVPLVQQEISANISINDGAIQLPELDIAVVPHAPFYLGYSTFSDNQIGLEWWDGSSIATQDTIYESTDDGITSYPIDEVICAGPDDYNSYTATGLSPGTEYQFYITSATEYAESAPTNLLVCTTTGIAPAPDLSATVSLPGQVGLAWTTQPNVVATGYTVTISHTADGSTITTQQTFAASATVGTIIGLTPGIAYTFSVQSDNQIDSSTNLQSAASNSVTVVPPSATLAATGPATVDEGGAGTLTLSSGTSSNITSWTVQWTDDYGNIISTNTVTGANGTDAYPAAITPGLTALVTAYDSAGNSYTLPVFDTSTVPIAPSDLSASAISSTEIDLAWNETSEAAEVYDVYRSDNGGAANLIAQLDPGTDFYDDTDLPPSDSAEYDVVAQGDASDAVSEPATASASTPTGVPVITSLVQDADDAPSATITWTYQGQDYNGFEIEAEDVTLGQNFELLPTYPQSTTFDSAANTLTGTASYGVNGGDTYVFRMRTEHIDGSVSSYNQSGPLTITQDTAPSLTVAAVTVGSGAYEQQELKVTWSLPSSDDGGVVLQVMSSAYGGTNWNMVWYGNGYSGAWPASTTPYYTYNPGVRGPGTYYYRISTVNAENYNTEWSPVQSGTIDGDTGAQPTVSASGTTITATWNASTGATSVLIEPLGQGAVIGNGASLPFVSGTLNSSTGMYTAIIDSLIPGTQYDFALWTPIPPTDDTSPLQYLFGDAIATTGGAVAPNAPDGLAANWNKSGNTQTNHYAHLSWKNESDNETGFELERSTDPSFPDDERTKVFEEHPDETTYSDLSLDYDHIYYYRVRSFNVFAYSGWSGTVSLTPGPIIVGFYGADTALTFPNAGNETIAEMQWSLVDAGFEVKVFESVLGEKPAKAWLLSHLTSGISQRTIEIFGHSWGGTTGVYLAQDIGKDPTFPDHTVSVLLAIDPVTLGIHWPGGGGPVVVPSNVVWFHDWYQTNPNGNEGIKNFLGIPGLLGLSNLTGKYLNSNAQNNDEKDYYDATNLQSKWHRVGHLSILDWHFLEDDILFTLSGLHLQLQMEHKIL